MVFRTIFSRAQSHEHVEVVLGGEAFSLVGQNPSFGRAPGGLALDGDGSLGVDVGSKDIDSWRVAHRDRGDEAPAGEFSRDEVFSSDTGKLRCGFHNGCVMDDARLIKFVLNAATTPST